jgi:hypothetical protein
MQGRTSHNHRWRHVTLVALLVGLTNCDSSTAPTWIDGVSVVARNQRIELLNRTTSPVFTIVLGLKAAESADWYPCVDPIQCPPIAPGERRDVPYPHGLGGVVEREALVYWWHATLGSDGVMHADKIRVGTVRL